MLPLKPASLRPFVSVCALFSGIIISVSGVLMFFHRNPVLSGHTWRRLHEWFGWGMVGVMIYHVLLNWPALMKYFKTNVKGWICALVLCTGILIYILLLPAPARRGPGGGAPRQQTQELSRGAHAPETH